MTNQNSRMFVINDSYVYSDNESFSYEGVIFCGINCHSRDNIGVRDVFSNSGDVNVSNILDTMFNESYIDASTLENYTFYNSTFYEYIVETSYIIPILCTLIPFTLVLLVFGFLTYLRFNRIN